MDPPIDKEKAGDKGNGPLLSSPRRVKSQSLSHSHTRYPHAVCDNGFVFIGWEFEER
jgi:hypothetical protein